MNSSDDNNAMAKGRNGAIFWFWMFVFDNVCERGSSTHIMTHNNHVTQRGENVKHENVQYATSATGPSQQHK